MFFSQDVVGALLRGHSAEDGGGEQTLVVREGKLLETILLLGFVPQNGLKSTKVTVE
jgi:hypothetical protein